jgi:D-alanine-D-alanine ligase
MRIVPASGVYDYHAKYQVNTTRYEILEAGEELDALAAQARVAWEALGCSGVGRVDLMGRLGPSGFDGYVLEVNTLPGMTQTSIIPKLAARRGWSFAQLASRMIVAARLERG